MRDCVSPVNVKFVVATAALNRPLPPLTTVTWQTPGLEDEISAKLSVPLAVGLSRVTEPHVAPLSDETVYAKVPVPEPPLVTIFIVEPEVVVVDVFGEE